MATQRRWNGVRGKSLGAATGLLKSKANLLVSSMLISIIQHRPVSGIAARTAKCLPRDVKQ